MSEAQRVKVVSFQVRDVDVNIEPDVGKLKRVFQLSWLTEKQLFGHKCVRIQNDLRPFEIAFQLLNSWHNDDVDQTVFLVFALTS